MLVAPNGCWQNEVNHGWSLVEGAVLARVHRVVEEKEKKDARREARASVRASRAKAGPPLRLPSCSGSSSDEMSESIGEGQLVDESISKIATIRASGLGIWAIEDALGVPRGKLRPEDPATAPAATAPATPAPAKAPGLIQEGPGGGQDVPSPASEATMVPGGLIARTFGLPHVSLNYELLGVQRPPPVPQRHRLPTPPRAPPAAPPAGRSGQTDQERQFSLAPPDRGSASSSIMERASEMAKATAPQPMATMGTYEDIAESASRAIEAGRAFLEQQGNPSL